jgi:hypothetical protein
MPNGKTHLPDAEVARLVRERLGQMPVVIVDRKLPTIIPRRHRRK